MPGRAGCPLHWESCQICLHNQDSLCVAVGSRHHGPCGIPQVYSRGNFRSIPSHPLGSRFLQTLASVDDDLHLYVDVLLYRLLSLYSANVLFLALSVQQGQNISKFSSQELRHFIIACISLGFYLGTSVFSFYPYREFKAIEYADNPAFADFINMKEEKKVSEEELRYNSHIDSSVPEPKDKRKKGTF